MNKNNMMMAMAALAIVVGVGGFFAGMKYQQSKAPEFGSGQFIRGQGNRGNLPGGSGAPGGRFGAGNRGGARPVNGDIISSDDTSITVKMMDGSSKIIMISDKTAINKAATALKSDLSVGQKVAVFGQENSDGSMTADNIQLNPMFGMRSPSPTPNSK